jgi:HD superfamily phosphohydrolase
MSIEVRDPIHGTIYLSTGETAVVDSQEFQRLRAIKQLGFADISFPGATHTRFLHSLGVCHLAGLVFDQMFKAFPFSHPSVKSRFRQVFRLGALLHDVGHGPLSHTTEEVMPMLHELRLAIYAERSKDKSLRATHEDYTIKYLMDSPLTEILKKNFSDISPIHVACLIDKSLAAPDDFFVDKGMDFRPLLSQLVSGELDCDRMDYLERDSYFTGTNYGKFDRDWMIANLIPYQMDQKYYLAINRRALYTFDDFLISRHHIHLMVYFHHKAIVFEEMLNRYLDSADADFRLPADINEYTLYNDFKLYEHLAQSKNEWAHRLAFKQPYKMISEVHSSGQDNKAQQIHDLLTKEGFNVIWASSKARLSKYHQAIQDTLSYPIFVIDSYNPKEKPMPIQETTEIFQKYESARVIERLYVAPERFEDGRRLIRDSMGYGLNT